MTKEQLEKHKIAARKLEFVKDEAFNFIKRNIGKVSEYEVHKFILSEFKKKKLVAEKKNPIQIIAVNEHAAIPHYFPSANKSSFIKKGDLILLDVWAKLEKKDSPFADITWMAYSGKRVPEEIKRAFIKVVRAQDIALSFIKGNLKKGKLLRTKTVDKVVRDYFKRFGLEKNFLHGTGHSLGIRECHGKYFRFGKKSRAKLKIEIPFTIEPGLYFKNKFGIRSEINCYITKEHKLIVTTTIQKEITKI